jgi:hypothetical protein
MVDTFCRGRKRSVTGYSGLLGSWLTGFLVERKANVVGRIRDSVPRSSLHGRKLDKEINVVRGIVGHLMLIAMDPSLNTNKKISSWLASLLKSDIIIITIVYTMAHFLMLLNNGIFWDDWIYINWDKSIMLDHFAQFGNIFLGYYFNLIFSLGNSVFIFRLLTFLAFLLSALLLNETLKTVKGIDHTSRLLLVLLFAIIPVNGARIAISVSEYALCYFFFFLGLWLTSRYIVQRTIIFRITALIFLFLSFFTNSFLVFYSVVLLYIGYMELKQVSSTSIFRLAARYVDFIIMPLLFWVLRAIFFQPHGIYGDYNIITVSDLILLPFHLVVASYNLLVELMIISRETVLTLGFLVIILLPLMYMLIRSVCNHNQSSMGTQSSTDTTFFLAGIILILIGLFAYLAVGKIPAYYDWQSRHELLLPLGFSFVLCFGFKKTAGLLKLNRVITIVLLSAVIVFCICACMSNYLAYQKDDYKQLSLMEQFESSDIMKNYTTFLFVDGARDLNARDRTYRFYEYTGMMAYVFDDETRFGCEQYEQSSFTNASDYQKYRNYKYRDYAERSLQYVVTVEKGSYDLDYVNLFRLMLDERFDRDSFNRDIGNVVRLDYEKIGRN